jgi:hypothetical protein
VNRSLFGIPVTYWAVGLIAGVIGFVWLRSRTKAPGSGGAGTPAQPSFTQAQEVQDFQIFSALTGAQQASDLNFLGEVAGLFAGGSSPTSATGGGGGGGSTVPAPPSTGAVPPNVQKLYGSELGKALPGGDLENFFLLNEANQAAGYDYFTSAGLQSTPLGVAPGET